MNKKKVFQYSILGFFSIFLVGCQEAQENHIDWNRYHNQFAGYEISYPSHYSIQEIPEYHSVAFTDKSNNNEILVYIPETGHSTPAEHQEEKEINTYPVHIFHEESLIDQSPIDYYLFTRPEYSQRKQDQTQEASTGSGENILDLAEQAKLEGMVPFIEMKGSGEIFENMTESFTFVSYTPREQYLHEYFRQDLLSLSPENIENDTDENGFPLWEIYDLDLISKANTAYIRYRLIQDTDTERMMEVEYTLDNKGNVFIEEIDRVIDYKREIEKYVQKNINELALEPAHQITIESESGATIIQTDLWVFDSLAYQWGYKVLVNYHNSDKQQQLIFKYQFKGYDIHILDKWKKNMWWDFYDKNFPLTLEYLETYRIAHQSPEKIAFQTREDQFLSINYIGENFLTTKAWMDNKYQEVGTGSILTDLYSPEKRQSTSARSINEDAVKKANIILDDGIKKRYIYFTKDNKLFNIVFYETKDMDLLKEYDRLINSIKLR
ncbi:MAG: hypothetical protein U9Q15_05030 [Patescibacteria group bacterium]|nr:hypothetical protein [Patescibacteria group bacterium]